MENLLEKMTKEDLYDFVANHYWEMSKEQLKEVTLSILGVVYDNMGAGASKDSEWDAFSEHVIDEYKGRNEDD